MKTEAQRIAIAETCGWGDIQNCTCSIEWRGVIPGGGDFKHIPDYLSDLNAIHEAEKMLRESQHVVWFNEMQRVLRIAQTPMNAFRFCHATAAQRAEAFLRTFGLWK